MKRVNRNTGITLIALVITIIVLLILAGVTIAVLSGDNGILMKAQEAKTQTKAAEEEELRNLAQAEAATNLKDTVYTDNSTGKDVTVTIPAGFAVSHLEGENTINDGLVIIDKNGNEFVWVPVENFNEFVRHDFEGKVSDSDFISTEVEDNKYYEPVGDGNNVDLNATQSVKEVQLMYKSVKENKGFYIGRYEAGTSTIRTEDSILIDDVVVKKKAFVYNYVKWGNSITDETGGAVELARLFSDRNGYTSVQSTLCYGVQWDAIMRWISEDDTISSCLINSIGKGWHVDNYQNGNQNHITGIDVDENKSNCIKNIYDMAGNVYEFTMERFKRDSIVRRGSHYNNTGADDTISHRGACGPMFPGEHMGFRVALYLN